MKTDAESFNKWNNYWNLQTVAVKLLFGHHLRMFYNNNDRNKAISSFIREYNSPYDAHTYTYNICNRIALKHNAKIIFRYQPTYIVNKQSERTWNQQYKQRLNTKYIINEKTSSRGTKRSLLAPNTLQNWSWSTTEHLHWCKMCTVYTRYTGKMS